LFSTLTTTSNSQASTTAGVASPSVAQSTSVMLVSTTLMKPSGAATATTSPTLSTPSLTNPPFPTLSLSTSTSMALSPTTSQESTPSSIIASFDQPTPTTSSPNPASTGQSTSNNPPASSSLGPPPSSGGLTVGDKATIAGSVLGGIAILATCIATVFSHEIRRLLYACFCCFRHNTLTYSTHPIPLSHIS
jgi:hypothetical protein